MRKVTALLAACLLVFTSCSYSLQEELVFIDLVKVYDQYTYAVDLNDHLKETYLAEREKLDQISMKMAIGMDSVRNYQAVQNRLNALEANFLKENEANKVVISNKLNQEIASFCESNNYRLVLGATGDGSVLYGAKELDITDKFLQYLNSRYEDE